MTSKANLEESMNSIQRFLNKETSKNLTNELNEVYETTKSFKYRADAAIQNGFKTLASLDRDVISNIEGSLPTQVVKQLGVVQLDASAKKSDLIKKVGSDAQDLLTIVGDSRLAANGVLDVAISAPFPEALAEVLDATTTSTAQEIKNIVSSNMLTELSKDNIIDNVLGDVLKTTKGLNSLSSELVRSQTNAFNALLNQASSGFNGLLENLVESSFKSTKNLLSTVTKKGNVLYEIPLKDIRLIVEAKQQDNIEGAIKILKRYSDEPDAVLRNVILQIDNRAAKALEPTQITVDIPTKRTDNFTSVWREATTDTSSKIFDTIMDMSEVETELSNLKREVTEIIIEAFPTRDETTTGVVEWHRLYVDNYNQGIEAHYYINYAGVLYRGRPLEIKGTGLYYEESIDHSERSILIAMEQPKNKPSTAQTKTLNKFFKAVFNVKPGIQVFGLYDILTTTESPFFDVQLMIKNNFGKENIKGFDPKKSPPLTQKQIIDGYN